MIVDNFRGMGEKKERDGSAWEMTFLFFGIKEIRYPGGRSVPGTNLWISSRLIKSLFISCEYTVSNR